jgi:CRP-like cAMP-binding protein
VLCHLTLSQITQFEEYLFRYEVKKGTFIWNKGDKANRAFIVESGSVKFDAPIPRSRRPSEMTTNRSNSQELAAALKEALTKDTLGQTPASNGDKVEQIESKVQKRPSRTAPKTLSRSNTASGTTGRADDSFRVPPLARGAFIADTDSLLGGTESSVGVVAAEDSTLLMIDRKDLIIFFSNNPGVLLATVHSHYVY